MSNSIAELDRLVERLNLIKDQWGLSDKFIMQLNLVLDELFTNIVNYGYNDDSHEDICFVLHRQNDNVHVTISDSGRAFDPTIPEDPPPNVSVEEKEVGGLGIYLVRQYTDSMHYRRENEKNIVTLTKKI